MEVAGVFLQLIECMSPSITRRWKYHRDAHTNMVTLRERSEELNCRKIGILATELVEGETEFRPEVKKWLERAEKIGGEVDGIDEKVRRAKLFRAGPGKLVNLKIVEVDKLCEKGEFRDGLVIHLPRPCGYEMPTTSTLGGDTTFKRKMEEIWRCLLDNEVAKVGIYGMGGIGKTTALEHTHNRILKDLKEDFKKVIWVTVSKESNIMDLQDKIARKLDLTFLKDEEVESRAQKLHTELKKKIPYALILDDLWDVYSLHEVGIPEPSLENRCKLIVTTRSHEVCSRMSCAPIEMVVLSEGEALKLFVDHVGDSVMSDPKLEAIVKDVARECAGLPLAIVTIAGSLKGKADINEWKIALEDLRDLAADSVSSDIYKRLKFSYDRLSDKKLQECLLYCALYPEDDLIEREMLIEHLMAEGIIEERKTRQSRIRKGHVMLNKLVNVCLLNEARDFRCQKCVKMHDLVRDMALKITSGSPRYLVKAGVGLRPVEENWDDGVEKVSFMRNSLSGISEVEPRKCSRLSTLLLQRNPLLSLPERFFLHMRMLNVLDLSETDMERLPESVSDLTNLTALFLRMCQNLTYVPSLAKLENLRLLDLYYSNVCAVPDGLKMLTKLRYLNLGRTKIMEIPVGTLCNLTDLQYLEFSCNTKTLIRFEEIANLRKLECIKGLLHDLDSFNGFVRYVESSGIITSYKLVLGCSILWNISRILDERINNGVILYNFTIPKRATAKEYPFSLPKDVEIFQIAGCILNVNNLCELASFKNVTKLRKLTLSICRDIKYGFSYSSDISPLLQSLEELEFYELRDLRGVFVRESGTSSVPFPHGNAFSSLKILRVVACHNMKKLCMISLPPNLEELRIERCSNLMEISSVDGTCLDDEEGEEISSSTDMVYLPKLKTILLTSLPKLQSLPLIADSVKIVKIQICPKLRRIPMLDREPFTSSLENVYIDNECLGSLEWDHPNAKSTIHSINKGFN